MRDKKARSLQRWSPNTLSRHWPQHVSWVSDPTVRSNLSRRRLHSEQLVRVVPIFHRPSVRRSWLEATLAVDPLMDHWKVGPNHTSVGCPVYARLPSHRSHLGTRVGTPSCAHVGGQDANARPRRTVFVLGEAGSIACTSSLWETFAEESPAHQAVIRPYSRRRPSPAPSFSYGSLAAGLWRALAAR